jgi:hypothetical protein
MFKTLKQAINFRKVERSTKGPAVATRATHIGIEIAIECFLCTLLYFPSQSRITSLSYVQFSRHRDRDVLRLPHFQGYAEEAT